VKNADRFAIVITHSGDHSRPIIDLPWLEEDYRIDESDWVVLSGDGWRSVAEGDAAIWDALERKLLIGFYVSQPRLIAVVGHPSGRSASDSTVTGRQEVRRIVRRIRSLLLPATVAGFWTDENGALQDILNPYSSVTSPSHDCQPVH
jgi:hypothetical protein